MMYEFLKLIVQPVVLERDSEGTVTGERLGEPTPLYSADQVVEYFHTLQQQIAQANADANGGMVAERPTAKFPG